MRILTVGNMYPPHHLGGYELMWRSAVAHHRAAGHDVRVLTTDWHEHYVDASTPEDADVHRELRGTGTTTTSRGWDPWPDGRSRATTPACSTGTSTSSGRTP